MNAYNAPPRLNSAAKNVTFSCKHLYRDLFTDGSSSKTLRELTPIYIF